MLADVKINDFVGSGVVIPTVLLQKDREGNTYVFSVDQKNNAYKVKKSYVKETSTYNSLSYISEGLMPNTLLVDKGARLIKANQTVIISE